jgi:RNA polymerase sigma-70 factor (ECF subfamily)
MRIWPRPATKGGEEAPSPSGNAAVRASAGAVEFPSDQAKGGSPDEVATFSRLYDEHVDFLWRSARRLGVAEDSADDVVQQVFVVVHRRLSEFEGRASVKSWLFAILLRVVQDHRRSLRRRSPHLVGEPTDPDVLPASARASDPYEALARAEASRLINQVLESLDEERRAVFVMAELEEMTPAEIAEALEIDAKAVYARLRGARADFDLAAVRLRKRVERGERPWKD